MRWIRNKLLAGCMALFSVGLLAGSAQALSINVADVDCDVEETFRVLEGAGPAAHATSRTCEI